MMGRYVLPWFGGGPAVWTNCLLFFQVLLLAGYAYAHWLGTRRSARLQGSLHMALLAASLKNAELLQELHENGLQDGLTGCFNRTHAIDSLDIELKRARRTKRPLSVLMFDLDSFKLINDRHGHLCGDAVLASVGDRMRGATRAGDLKCRYGGDEFIVLLPETPAKGAFEVAERIRNAINTRPLELGSHRLQSSVSIGIATFPEDGASLDALAAHADRAMYAAKQAGRNRSVKFRAAA